jgi:CheY-like chemotaxis protein
VLAEKLSRPLAITLIDDHAKSNGWAYVAQLIHNNALLSNIEFEGIPSNLSFQEFFSSALFDRIQGADLLLLDLRMPMIKGDEASIETGLRIAETVKSLDPLLPIVLLSAHNESITMRRAIALGATEFFPKEAPPLNNSALVVHYANQFSMLPRYLKLADDDWLKFSARCRALMINLENFVSNARMLPTTANLPAFFSNIINNQGIFSALPLAPGVKHSVKNVHISVAGHALWLLRRAVFFLSMHRERYLSNWLCYFAAAVPELRAGMLGYDQVWVNCAMLVEYLFNVVAFTRCGATEPRTPASRSSIEQTKLQSFLEPQFYALGMGIWETRNERRYTEERSRDTEEQMAREMISKSIDFLVGIGFCWPSLGVVKAPPVSLANLRDNLKRSIQRRDLGRKVAQMEELLQKSGQISRAGTEQAKTLQLRYDEYVSAKGELEALRPEQILTERRLILAHLRPPLDGPISVDPLADLT